MTAGQFLPPLPPPEAAEAAPGLDAAGAPAPATAAGLAEMTEDGVGGGIMAVIMEAEDGNAYNSSQVDIRSRPNFAAMAREKFPNIDQQMDQLIKDIISNPSCDAERKINVRTEAQISYLKAIKYIQR